MIQSYKKYAKFIRMKKQLKKKKKKNTALENLNSGLFGGWTSISFSRARGRFSSL